MAISFLFASSHLPAVRSTRPELEEEEEEKVNPESLPRSGGVRASSHLRAEEGNARTTQSQMPDRLLKARPKDLRKQDTDGVAAAKASGVFDVVREQYNRSDSSHYMDEDGNLSPRQNSGPQGGAGVPASTAEHTPDDTTPWYHPPLMHEDLHHEDLDGSAIVAPSTLEGRPMINDLMSRHNGSPEEAGEHARGFMQNLADIYSSPPPQAAKGGGFPQGESPRPAGNPSPSSSSQKTFQQASPHPPAASPDKTTPQQPVQNAETPYEDLLGYLKKSKNPLFIKNFYDHRTPLEEKLRLRQLILSLRAPEGEKLPLYIQHLQHWFNSKNRPPADSKEEPVKHALKDLMQWPVVKEAFNKVLYRFGSLPDGKLGHKTIFDWVRAHPDAAKPGGVAVPDTYWDVPADGSHPNPVKKYFGLPKPGNEGYFYAFGGAPMTATSSGVRGIVDKNGGVRFRGTFNVRLHDRYDWNLDQGTLLKPDPKIPMDKIRRYIPKDIPVISPQGDEIQISDSFFKEMLEKGYGRDYDIEAPYETLTLEFYQAKPGGPFQYKVIPRTP